jgi:hypothetical protein
MEIKDILEGYKIKKTGVQLSERSELVKKFVERLNSDRRQTGRKDLPASFYAIKMAQAKLNTQDLYWFWRYCEDAQNFSSTWWWSLNSKNAKNL